MGATRPDHGQDRSPDRLPGPIPSTAYTHHPRWSMGILNDKYTMDVPGSVTILNSEQSRSSASDGQLPGSDLRRDNGQSQTSKKTTKDGTIVLEPQPDDSHNDPLNWPSWKRNLALMALGVFCMVGGGMAPVLAAGFPDAAKDFNVRVESIALTIGLYMMGLGIGSVFAAPTAVVYGKRPVYLASAVLFIVTSVWCALSTSFTSLIAARVFQGMSISSVECLPSATIADIFFLHERAFKIGIYNVLILSGKNLVPLVSAVVIGQYGWRWVFWISALAMSVCLVFVFLFVPFTVWHRLPLNNTRKLSSIGVGDTLSRITSTKRTSDAKGVITLDAGQLCTPGLVEQRNEKQFHHYVEMLRDQPRQSYRQQLNPFHGRLNNNKWSKVALRPFILFAYPPVLWSAIVYSCSIGWLIVVTQSMSIIFRNPATYNFSAIQTGLLFISPLVGSILGAGVAGRVGDSVARYMAKRNGGLFEPEFRLVMIIPVLVTTCVGLMGYGWTSEKHQHWAIPTVFFGIVSFGCSLGSTTSIAYCVDCYRQHAAEALVTLNVTKNICHGMVFSLFFAQWVTEEGPKDVFVWIGVIQVGLMLLSVPMYVFGKRARMWTKRRGFLEKL